MAKHGSKKWIRTYDGKIKRSNDRTKKDYYRELKWWKPVGHASGYRHAKKEEFCPQCKHNYKPIKAHNDAYWAAWHEIRDEWNAMIGDRIKAYKREYRAWVNGGCVGDCPENPESSRDYVKYWAYIDSQRHRVPAQPIHDAEAWLCPKHRLKNDKRDEMWLANYPGRNQDYQWMRRQEYVYYRAEVKNLMRKAKYDEDVYDDIPPKKVNGWLD